MKLKSLLVLTMVAGAIIANAAPINFTLGKGSPAMQIAQVESVADFETFTGRSHKVSGNVTFDPTKKTGSAKVVIDAASVSTGIDLRDEHMRSAQWLDTDKYKTIEFVTTKVQHVKGDDYKVTGKFTMHGVTKTITVNATVKYMKASSATQNAGLKGDVVQVKTSFKVNLSDYKVMVPAQAKSKVSNTVTISLTVFGQSGA